jgi:hypothetical protein
VERKLTASLILALSVLSINAQIVERCEGQILLAWTNVPPRVIIEGSTNLTESATNATKWRGVLRVENLEATSWQTFQFTVQPQHEQYKFWRWRSVQPCN